MNYFNTLFKTGNSIANQMVINNPVVNSIKQAATKTGVNFAYLMEQAAAESNFNPTAKAKTSSATGLYQFIESTWLNTVKKFGEKHGLGHIADKISYNDKGKAIVTNPADKQAILSLRNDPDKASAMAAELAKSNETYLKHHVRGVEVGKTELYLAHFMGAGGAARFLNAMNNNPDQNAAALFKKEARANKNVFTDAKTGDTRSLKEVYAFFDKKFDKTLTTPDTSKTMVAANTTNTLGAEQTNKQPSTGFVMDDNGTPFFFNGPSTGNKTIVASAGGVGYTRRLDAETMFFIQQITSQLDQLAWGDHSNDTKNRMI